MKKEKPYLSPLLSVGVTTTGIAMAGVEGAKIIAKGVKEFFIPTAHAPSDASQLSQRTAQQQLTPVGVTFNESFSGTMSQTIGKWGHSSTPFEGNFTGSRTGVLPGNFTGNFTGTNTYDPPLQANPNYVNISFTGSMSGETKPGFRESELKVQNVGVTITDNRVPNKGNIFTYSGDGTLKADGSLNVNLRPPDNQPQNNYQYGTCPACGYVGTSTIQLNQTKTTP